MASSEKQMRSEDEQTCMTDYGTWAQEGGDKVITGKRLDMTEGILINKNKEMVTDGSFVESKELVAGVGLIQEENFQKAVDFAHTCLFINYFNLFIKEVKN